MAQFEVYAVRHGQSMANSKYVIQGHTSTPLSEFGLKQAATLTPRLAGIEFTASYSSDLERAMQTAQIAVPYLQPVPMYELREWHLGVFQGLTRDEAASRYPEAWQDFISSVPNKTVPGGESTEQVDERVKRFIDYLVSHHDSGRILVASHSGTLRSMLKIMMERGRGWKKPPQLANAAICRFLYIDGDWQLISWNETEHLNGLVAKTGNY